VTTRVPRRTALKQLGVAGAGAMLVGRWAGAQGRPITIAGRPVEISIASVSDTTVRLTVAPMSVDDAASEEVAEIPDVLLFTESTMIYLLIGRW